MLFLLVKYYQDNFEYCVEIVLRDFKYDYMNDMIPCDKIIKSASNLLISILSVRIRRYLAIIFQFNFKTQKFLKKRKRSKKKRKFNISLYYQR